jgi:hypothetical protein
MTKSMQSMMAGHSDCLELRAFAFPFPALPPRRQLKIFDFKRRMRWPKKNKRRKSRTKWLAFHMAQFNQAARRR